MRLTVTIACLIAAAADAQPFNRLQSGGNCTFWNTRSLSFFMDAAGNPETTGNTEFTAVQNAIATWVSSTSGCSDLVLSYGGTVTAPRVEYVPSGPNQNVIVFRQTPCSTVVPANDPCLLNDSCGNAYACWNHSNAAISVPTITTRLATGEILDVDLELNVPSFVFTTVDAPPCVAPNFNQSCVATDVQNTITPMIGRGIGLASVNMPGSTMSPATSPGDLSKRVIDNGTVSGFCAIYPRGLPPTSCDGGVAISDAGTTGGGAGGGTGGSGGSGGSGGGAGTGGSGGGTTGGGAATGGSGAPSPCSSVTCAGCCTFDGRCELGTTDVACGVSGLSCASCNASDSCQQGQCKPAARGCSCSSIEALGSALLLALIVRRRRTAS